MKYGVITNDYGCMLNKDFIKKSGMLKDMKENKFEGTLLYEDHIKTVQDAAGWMLESYDCEALNVIDMWLEYLGGEYVWGIKMLDIQDELKKCFDITREEIKRKEYALEIFNKYGFVSQIDIFQSKAIAEDHIDSYDYLLQDGEYLKITKIIYDEDDNEIGIE